MSISLSLASISPVKSGNSVFHKVILLMFTGAWRRSGACSSDSKGLYSSVERRACSYHNAHNLPTRKMDTDEERERKGGSVSVSISFFSGAGFNKPLGRKWGGRHPLTCSHLPSLSLSEKQFKQLMDPGFSSRTRGYVTHTTHFWFRAPQA